MNTDFQIVSTQSGRRQVSLPVPDLKNELRLVTVLVKKTEEPLRVIGVGVDVTVNPGEEARFSVQIDFDLYAAVRPDYQTEREKPLKWVLR